MQRSRKDTWEKQDTTYTLHQIAFDDVVDAQHADNWKKVAGILWEGIEKLKCCGAKFVIIPANSTHFCIDALKKKSPLPIISMLTIVAEECAAKNYKKVGVLGVGITMKNGLFKKPLQEKGIVSLVPEEAEQKIINDIIYQQIVPGVVKKDSVTRIVHIIAGFQKKGCDAIILGCTELPIVITAKNSPLPYIDTTRLLAEKALAHSLNAGSIIE
ncbi:amino acid racemase [Candidatus Woesearchaeota archaeon]|nr:amino acid racemase [Candidatus Woesearchaeota archaeon]